MPSRRLNPDTALEIQLNGTARRLIREGADWDKAVRLLRDLAAGRTDLLGRAAGSMIGGYLGAPGMSPPDQIKAAAVLVAAGADPDFVAAASDETQARTCRGGYSTPV